MRGGALTLARMFNESGIKPDCLLVTDMVDLSILLSLIKTERKPPVVLYMHENQLTYPWSETDPDPALGRDHHYAFINYTSCLAADAVVFNSHYHKESFLNALPGFLNMFPDHREERNIDVIQDKSTVMHLGLELKAFDKFKVESNALPKTILWNHRWEYDKDPESFFNALIQLSGEGFDFRLVVCGESSKRRPDIFDAAQTALASHIDHWGRADSFDEYATLLMKCDILPVTSKQDFFGISMVEATYCDVFPLLPKRLAFREHIPHGRNDLHFYTDPDDMISRLRELLGEPVDFRGRDLVSKYDWGRMINEYDRFFENAAEG